MDSDCAREVLVEDVEVAGDFRDGRVFEVEGRERDGFVAHCANHLHHRPGRHSLIRV